MPRFSDIQGQDQAIQVLRRAVLAEKVAHAFLFSGPEGVGKATCALALAAALNCDNEPGEGCDSCTSCYKLDQGFHPDLVHISRDGKYIKVEQVRALEEKLAFRPHEGQYRLVLIDGAENLNSNAANALLKSVEEPRPRTLFVLTSSAGHLVAPTLVSRCQRIRFLPLKPELIVRILGRHSAAQPELQKTAAILAEGSVKRALRYLESDQMAYINKNVGALLDAASTKNNTKEIFDLAASAGKDRLQITEALDVLRVWLRDVLLCSEGLEQGRLVNIDKVDQLKAQAARQPHVTILRQLRAVTEAQSAIQGMVNPALTLEHLVLKMR